MFRKLSFVLAFVGFCAVAQGQNAANPFELLHRLSKEVLAAEGISLPPANPFDVVAHREPDASESLAENKTEAFNPFSVLPRGGGLSGSVLAALLLAVFAFLTFSVASNRAAVGKAWGGFLNDNGFSVAQREASGFVGTTPYYLLYVNFLFNAGIFVFLVTRVFQRETFNNIGFLLFCLAGAITAFLSKHLMLRIMRGLFPVEAEVRKYNFLIIIFNCVLGLFLVPFNLLIAFSAKAGSEQLLLVSWMLGLVAIFYAYRTLRASPIGLKFLSQSPFHFLLYFCTVEIAPILLLVKLALMQTT
ncbi:MAG: DUF4271 domain-containing protein [Saprospiraceae bacterium]|nr:DUF4271 domain-containing protein [Saprospiraceae bacterium]